MHVTIKTCVIFVHVLWLSNILSLSYVALKLSKFGHPWFIGKVVEFCATKQCVITNHQTTGTIITILPFCSSLFFLHYPTVSFNFVRNRAMKSAKKNLSSAIAQNFPTCRVIPSSRSVILPTYAIAYILLKLNIHFTKLTGLKRDWRPNHPCC